SPAKIIRLPREKDDTDTAFALKYVLELGFREIYLIGAFGALADHSLANLGLLKFARDRGSRAVLIDDYSVMEVITGTSRISDSHRYFSLLAIYGTASNVSISNAKYRIKNATVTPENPFAVSNEIIDGDALVCIGEGALLLIQSDQH
ncbi:MAG: thiamine diphosphokinase, partial [Bacillota bacterium]|nr:thiamine diphosphokinase [Bacillota bacterium]